MTKIRRFPKPTRTIFASICCLSICAYFIFSYVLSNSTPDFTPEEIDQIVLRVHEYSNPSSQCILPKLNPWDPLILKEMQIPEPTMCTPTIDQLTSLSDGLLQVISNQSSQSRSDCYYRCLHPVNHHKMKVDNWTEIDFENGSRPGCDVVEVSCGDLSNPDYSFVHTQIVEKPRKAPTSNVPKYNFYWFLIDSVSMSMFKRAMPQTIKVLKDKFGAVEFPYLNKIALNSRPNSYAMFFGEDGGSECLFFVENFQLVDQTVRETLCTQPLDSLPYISFDFHAAGYYTHETEDLWTGVVDWADCVGFAENNVDHFMRPFWFAVGYSVDEDRCESPAARHQMWEKSCKNEQHYIREQFLQFVNAYDGKPKFSMTWNVVPTHNDNPTLFAADAEFANFFDELSEKAQDSFIFFQGDHGIRFGKVRKIPVIGELEDNNPFLYIIVPEKLRQNPTLMQNLRDNSRQLLSHFDLHASVVQVVKFSHGWTETTNFDQEMTPVPNRTFIGSSIFHKMNQPRTCENLGIPSIYCICGRRYTAVNDKKLAIKVVEFLVSTINQQLENSEYKNLCQKHTISYDYQIQLEELKVSSLSVRTLKAKFETLPGRALYQTSVNLYPNQTFTLMDPSFPRINSYASQAQCIPEQFLRNYCVCR